MKKTLFLGALCVAGLIPAFASAETVSNSAAPDPNETICRSVADTGSRVGHVRVCMTRAEWEQQGRNRRGNSNRSQPRANPPQS